MIEVNLVAERSRTSSTKIKDQSHSFIRRSVLQRLVLGSARVHQKDQKTSISMVDPVRFFEETAAEVKSNAGRCRYTGGSEFSDKRHIRE